MGRKRTSGLTKRTGIWHIDKQLHGRRICQSTGTDSLEEAECFLAHLVEETRQASVYGVRPQRRFEQAAAKFVLENGHKRSLKNDISLLKLLLPWIGATAIDRLHMGTLQPWVEARQQGGAAAGTINHGLKVVRHILNLAASEWVDEHGLTWLQVAPKIRLLPDTNKRQPYPLNWGEQEQLFRELPEHLAQMALFAVNTGCRDSEICHLRWEWEVKVPELHTTIFMVPANLVKNGDERLVVLNRVAMNVVEHQRGKHSEFVFTYKGNPITHMLNTGWRNARKTAGSPKFVFMISSIPLAVA